jgi:hypothetical protein
LQGRYLSEERAIDQATLLDYLDGNLEAGESEAVRAAIANSAQLRQDLSDLEAIRDDLSALSLPVTELPQVDLAAAVLGAIQDLKQAELPLDYLDRDSFLEEILNHAEPGTDPAPLAAAIESPVHEEEFKLVHELMSDLEAIGDAWAKQLPQVDLVDSVMETVRTGGRPANVTPINQGRSAAGWYWIGGLGAAAAALIAIMTWFNGAEDPGASPPMAPGPVVSDSGPPTDPPEPSTESPSQTKAILASIIQSIEEQERANSPVKVSDEPETAATPLNQIEARGVFQLRAEAATNSLKREQLSRLAKLPPGLAGEVVLANDASAQARMAAATMLSTEEASEAIASLRDTGVLGDDAYSHFQVALAFLTERGLGDNEPVENPVLSLEDALQSITALQEQDPDNALAWYMEAAARYYAGDSQGAMVALEEAGTRTEASAYSGEAALANQDALTEAGMDPEAASSVAAFTSGTDEYRALLDLGLELLTMGQEFAGSDPAAAESVFTSVDTLGQQLQTDPEYSYEYLAGLDLQLEAISVFEEFWHVLGLSDDSMTTLTGEAESLGGAYTDFQAMMMAINAVFFQDITDELMNSIIGVILGEGDLYLPSYFPAN